MKLEDLLWDLEHKNILRQFGIKYRQKFDIHEDGTGPILLAFFNNETIRRITFHTDVKGNCRLIAIFEQIASPEEAINKAIGEYNQRNDL